MEPHTIIYITFSAITLILVLWNIHTHIRLRALMRGKRAQSLEQTILDVIAINKKHAQHLQDTDAIIADINARLKQSIQGVAVERFNPFGKDGGGNQSFAIALIDEHGDGVVLSSLYARDRMRIFAKPVSNYTSSYDLTEEEQRALGKARQ